MLSDEYYLWGAGTYGDRLVDFMKDDIKFKAIIDSNPQKQGSILYGLPVISYNDAKKDLPEVKIVIAINIPSKVQGFLLEEGLRKNTDFFVMNSFLPRYFWAKNKTLVIKAADIAATTKCTMKCEGCLAFIPIAKNQSHFSGDSIMREVVQLFNHIDKVMNLNFCVGESLLNDELPDILCCIHDKYKGHYSFMSIQTNGTVLPSDNAMRRYREANALFVIANYPENSMQTKKLIDKCQKYGVSWFFNAQGGGREIWLDYGDPRVILESDPDKLRALYAKCWQPGMAVYNGLLYICAAQAWAHLVAETGTPEPGDAFDLRQPKTEASCEDLYKIVSHQQPGRGYISHCMRCNGAMTPLYTSRECQHKSLTESRI